MDGDYSRSIIACRDESESVDIAHLVRKKVCIGIVL